LHGQEQHPEAKVREIGRKTRRRYLAEEKVRVEPQPVRQLERGVPGGGNRRLRGDTKREATSSEVTELKHLVADLSLRNLKLKKGLGGTPEGEKVVAVALEKPEMLPGERAGHITDT